MIKILFKPIRGKRQIRYLVKGVEFTSLISASQHAYPDDHIKRNVVRWNIKRRLGIQ